MKVTRTLLLLVATIGVAMLLGCRSAALPTLTPAPAPLPVVAAPPVATPKPTPVAIPAPPSKRLERLKLAWSADTGYPSPFAFSPVGPGGIVKLSLIYDTLTWKDEKGIIPWLADSWEVSADATRYTFNLNPKAKWQDGKSFTAWDVVFTFDYYKKHPFKWGSTAMIERVEVKGPQTVVFHLKRPFAPFLEDVVGTIPIIPEHIWSKVEDPIKFRGEGSATGTGPFTLVSHKEELGAYLFRANPDFFKGRPLVEELNYLLVPTVQQVPALKTRLVDMVFTTDFEVAQVFGTRESAFKVFRTPPGSIVRLNFNVNKEPLGSTEFRHAIAHALNRQAIGERVIGGDVIVGNPGVIPPESPWHNPKVRQYPYDPGRAKALLDALRLADRDGDGLREFPDGRRLQLSFVHSAGDRNAELVIAMLKEVGLDIKSVPVDPKTRAKLAQEFRFELLLQIHIGVTGDPDFLRRWFAGEIYNEFEYGAIFANEEFMRLAEEQARLVDFAGRKRLLDRMQAILAEEVPTLPLYYRRFYWVYDPGMLDTWFNTWGGLMTGIPLLENKLAFLPR